MAKQTPFKPLTGCEREILTLLNQGLSDREIAERFIVACTTVKWYNCQIYNKLGAENRQQAVEYSKAVELPGSAERADISRNNLPAQVTPFVGPVQELFEVSQWLSGPAVTGVIRRHIMQPS